jgi:hypothetical protein
LTITRFGPCLHREELWVLCLIYSLTCGTSEITWWRIVKIKFQVKLSLCYFNVLEKIFMFRWVIWPLGLSSSFLTQNMYTVRGVYRFIVLEMFISVWLRGDLCVILKWPWSPCVFHYLNASIKELSISSIVLAPRTNVCIWSP